MSSYTTVEAAAKLGTRPSTLLNAIFDRRIPAPSERFGRAYIWTDLDIEQAAQILGLALGGNWAGDDDPEV